jgi:hypothetical protein
VVERGREKATECAGESEKEGVREREKTIEGQRGLRKTRDTKRVCERGRKRGRERVRESKRLCKSG